MKYLLIGLLLLGLMLGAYEGIYKQGTKKVANDKIYKDEEVYLEIIWDASGSMWGREEGIEKILRSKDVLKTITEKAPENINIGLRIFGARKPGDLTDSFLAVPIARENKETIENFITNIRPLGKSPIGLSLKRAKEDLEKVDGKKYIILVSDGIDNGKVPPTNVIEHLQEDEISLNIVHIGNLDDKELKEKLEKIAGSTGGKYFNYKQDKEVIAVLD